MDMKSLPVSDFLGRSITTYKENFLLLLNFSCAASAPVIFKMLLQSSEDQGLAALGTLLGPVVFCVYVFFFLCLIFVAASLMQGQVLEPKEVMAHVWKKFWQGIACYLVFGIAVMAGLFLLIVPGIYCFTVLSFFAFAVLLEDKGVWASFKRSDELVKGSFWPVLGANAIIMLLMAGLFLPIILGLKMMGVGDLILFVILGVAGALVAPAFIIFYYLIYDQLKNEKDGALNISVRSS
jgi:hypothetical protein